VSWPAFDRDWLSRSFAPGERPDVGASMAAFEGLFERLRRHTGAPILIYNLSPIIPGEWIHCHQGFGDSLSTQIRRFNLGLLELSERLGISVIDVDGVLARAGADRLKLDAIHLTPDGYRLVAEEVVRVLEDLALL
jgi:lysophospholipase L1-like esterase